MVLDCKLFKPDSELDWRAKEQYAYAVNLLNLQEISGFSFLEARVYLHHYRNESLEKIAKEFDSGYDEDGLYELYWELKSRVGKYPDLTIYLDENTLQYDRQQRKEENFR